MNILSKTVGFCLLAAVLLAGCDPSGGDGGVTVGVESDRDDSLFGSAIVTIVAAQGVGFYTGTVAATVNGQTTTTTTGSALGSAPRVDAGNPLPFAISLDGTQVVSTSVTQPEQPTIGAVGTPAANSDITISWNDLDPDPGSFRLTIVTTSGLTTVYDQASIPGSSTSHVIPANTLTATTQYQLTLFAHNRQSISGDGLASGSYVRASWFDSVTFTPN